MTLTAWLAMQPLVVPAPQMAPTGVALVLARVLGPARSAVRGLNIEKLLYRASWENLAVKASFRAS